MYIAISQWSELNKEVQNVILSQRPELKNYLAECDDRFHIFEDGNVFLEKDLIYNHENRQKPVPCFIYNLKTFDFAQFFNNLAYILDYPNIKTDQVVKEDSVHIKYFINSFNLNADNFGLLVCKYFINQRYVKLYSFMNKYNLNQNIARKILDHFTEIGFFKRARDGWNVTSDTECVIANQERLFLGQIKNEEKKEKKLKNINPKEEVIDEEYLNNDNSEYGIDGLGGIKIESPAIEEKISAKKLKSKISVKKK